MVDPETAELELDASLAGQRLDVALARLLHGRSRSLLTRLLKDGAILLNGRDAKPSYKVRGGERVEIEWPEPDVIEARPEAIPLDVIFEDGDVIAVNKPAGMCVHPSAGHTTGTLVNALLHHCTDLSSINGAVRPGIVHRLDADTTGVIIAAKNDAAHQGLQEQFMARTVCKTYVALCYGDPRLDRFSCDGRIGRHPVRRKEMTVMRDPAEGRAARTDFEVVQRLSGKGKAAHGSSRGPVFLVLARPHTGRTHQIRVHLAKAGYPILADLLYGREESLPELNLSRHALHALRLEIDHPRTGNRLRLEAPLADDMKSALLALGGSWPIS